MPHYPRSSRDTKAHHSSARHQKSHSSDNDRRDHVDKGSDQFQGAFWRAKLGNNRGCIAKVTKVEGSSRYFELRVYELKPSKTSLWYPMYTCYPLKQFTGGIVSLKHVLKLCLPGSYLALPDFAEEGRMHSFTSESDAELLHQVIWKYRSKPYKGEKEASVIKRFIKDVTVNFGDARALLQSTIDLEYIVKTLSDIQRDTEWVVDGLRSTNKKLVDKCQLENEKMLFRGERLKETREMDQVREELERLQFGVNEWTAGLQYVQRVLETVNANVNIPK